jgi:hypothetical protein
MELLIHRALRSIMFVRCLTPIDGKHVHAEGTAFSTTTAIAKCRSETVERRFLANYELRSRVIGIAAHPRPEESQENAFTEALETLLLESLRDKNIFTGIPLWNFRTKIWLGCTKGRFICLITFPYANAGVATQAVSRNPIREHLARGGYAGRVRRLDSRRRVSAKGFKFLTHYPITSHQFSPVPLVVPLEGITYNGSTAETSASAALQT